MMKHASIVALVSALLLSGCAVTLEDFMMLTPEERARQVCSNAEAVRSLNAQITALARTKAQTEADLARGYKLHRECREIPVQVGSRTHCRDVPGGRDCRTTPEIAYQTQCRDIPVALNLELERQKLAEINSMLPTLTQKLSTMSDACYRATLLMPAAMSYEYYRSGTMPQ